MSGLNEEERSLIGRFKKKIYSRTDYAETIAAWKRDPVSMLGIQICVDLVSRHVIFVVRERVLDNLDKRFRFFIKHFFFCILKILFNNNHNFTGLKFLQPRCQRAPI